MCAGGDEKMKCPKCKAKIEPFDEVCPNCKTSLANYPDTKTTSASILNILAAIYLLLAIAGAIFVWVKFSTIEVIGEYSYILERYTTTTQTNWYAIIGGFGVIFSGVLVFFTLTTIVDIYDKLDN